MKNKYFDIIIFGDTESNISTSMVNYLTESFNFSVNTFNFSLLRESTQLNVIKDNIKKSLYIMILITDQKNKSITSPFSILINLFHKVGQNNILIIREKKMSVNAIYDSNLKNKYSEIIFDKKDLTSLYIKLNRELFDSKRISKNIFKSTSDFSAVRKESLDLNNFLDEMDRIWEQEFDMAADYIERNDWKTEKEFQNKLDAFFIKYWAVFDAMIRGKKEGKSLKKISDAKLEESYLLAFDVWFIVVKSRLEALDEKIINVKGKPQKMECSKPKIDKLYKTLDKLINVGKQNKKSIENKIGIVKEINDNISECF